MRKPTISLWSILWYQMMCVPTTLLQDLRMKLGNLWDQAWQTTPEIPEWPELTPGKPVMVFFPGWNQTSANFLKLASRLAELINATLCMMHIPGGYGNIFSLREAMQHNMSLIPHLVAHDGIITLVGYSRGGKNAIRLAGALIRRGVHPSRIRVYCIATPVLGSYHGLIQYHLLRLLQPVLGWLHPFFRAVDAAEEMVPDSDAVADTTNMVYDLFGRGVYFTFFRFAEHDALVMPHQAAPDGFKPVIIEKSKGHCGFCSRDALWCIEAYFFKDFCNENDEVAA